MFFFVMVLASPFAQNVLSYQSVIPVRIDPTGILENPGPHKICVGYSAPPFKVKGSYIAPSGNCFYSPKVFSVPQVPKIFDTPGTYTYEIKVKGILDFLSRSEDCPVVDQEKIGDFRVIVKSGGSCCDQCNGDEEFELAGVYLTSWMNRVSPGNMYAFEELLNFVTQESVGWASRGVVNGRMDNLLINFILKRPYEKIFNAIGRVDNSLMKKYGAKIWVQFERKACREKFCLPFSKEKVWHYQTTSTFYPCSIGYSVDLGLGFGRDPAAAAREIERAIPLCINEAEKNAYYFK